MGLTQGGGWSREKSGRAGKAVPLNDLYGEGQKKDAGKKVPLLEGTLIKKTKGERRKAASNFLVREGQGP